MLYKYFVIASDVALFVLLVILSDVASAAVKSCSRSKRKQLLGTARVISAKESVFPLKEKRIATGLKPLAMTGGVRIAAVALRLACRLGRCFCFAEVSTGHPHLRNDNSFILKVCHTNGKAKFIMQAQTL